MATRIYSYKGKDTDWKIRDPRLSPENLIPKWDKWIKATRIITTGPDTGPDHNERTEYYANRIY
jgi:hypothetical protein